jgi:hypothetical protein
MVITESQIVETVSEELKKSDVMKIIKNDKDFEKRVKEIITDVISELFRVLWQHGGIYKSLVR